MRSEEQTIQREVVELGRKAPQLTARISDQGRCVNIFPFIFTRDFLPLLLVQSTSVIAPPQGRFLLVLALGGPCPRLSLYIHSIRLF